MIERLYSILDYVEISDHFKDVSIMLCNNLFFRIIYLTLILSSTAVHCGPWLTPSEAWETSAGLASKSDVALLADYGFIKAPILTWPLAWADIGPSLLSDESQKKIKSSPQFVQLAYFRMVSQYQHAIGEKLKSAAYVSGGQHINPFRTFDYQPRADVQGGLALDDQRKWWAAKLSVDYGQYNDVTQHVHLDDSYAYLLLGNWAVGLDKQNNWWGPGYSSSMIFSSNPPPLAKFTFRRRESLPFESKWLSWIGPWSVTTSLSMGGPDEPIAHPLIWFINLSARPLESLQLSLSKNAIFAGDSRPLNWRMLQNLATSDDNCDPAIYGEDYCRANTPGNELWEVTADWNAHALLHIPTNLYLQTTFNDRIPSNSYMGVYDAWHSVFPSLNPPIPARTAFLAGSSTWFGVKDQLVRLYAEFEYTHQYAYYFWGEVENNIYGGAYPYQYYGKLLGSTIGSDSTGYTVGGILNETNGSNDSLMARYLQLNQNNANAELGFPWHQDVLWLSVSRSVSLPVNLGRLSGQLGYLQSMNGVGFKSTPSFNLTWTKNLT